MRAFDSAGKLLLRKRAFCEPLAVRSRADRAKTLGRLGTVLTTEFIAGCRLARHANTWGLSRPSLCFLCALLFKSVVKLLNRLFNRRSQRRVAAIRLNQRIDP